MFLQLLLKELLHPELLLLRAPEVVGVGLCKLKFGEGFLLSEGSLIVPSLLLVGKEVFVVLKLR
jgi:hypothetical protein